MWLCDISIHFVWAFLILLYSVAHVKSVTTGAVIAEAYSVLGATIICTDPTFFTFGVCLDSNS